MDHGFSATRPVAKLTALILCFVLAACIPIKAPAPSPDNPEEELAMQARALQRTVLEGAMLGAAAGAAASDRAWGYITPVGVVMGASVGTVTGSYLGYLQNKYATNELRLERLKSDIDLTNAETEAAIQTMRVVLDRQSRELAAIRAQSAGASPDLDRAVGAAEESLNDMRLAIQGARQRQTDFSEVRALKLVDTELTGVDSEIAELGSRIAQMREIADTLAAEI